MYIIATISKNHDQPDKIREIILAGASVLRYNCAHGSPAEVLHKIDLARAVIVEMGYETCVRIMADLPGAKGRIASFPEKEFRIQKDQRLVIKDALSSTSASKYVPVEFEHLNSVAKEGLIISIDDGEITFEIERIIDAASFVVTALNGGLMRPNQSVNVPSQVDNLNHLTARALDHIRFLPQVCPDLVAFSFVNSASYITQANSVLQQYTTSTWKPKLAAKIESPRGVQNIEEIVQNVDVVIIARGDLGLTIPFERIGIAQKELIRVAKKYSKEAVVATQIMESVIDRHVPKRAEILDLTNIVLDGADGILLAKETGWSPTPGRSVKVARQIIECVECYVAGQHTAFSG
jgi:pyruvate kinase